MEQVGKFRMERMGRVVKDLVKHTQDIVLFTNDNQRSNVDIGPEFSTSDHRSVLFTIECNIGVRVPNNSYEKSAKFSAS